MNANDTLEPAAPTPMLTATSQRFAVWCGAIGAFLIVYLLVYPLVPISLKQSGLGQRLPDWIETAFEVSAAPLALTYKTVPAYRDYVKFLDGVLRAG